MSDRAPVVYHRLGATAEGLVLGEARLDPSGADGEHREGAPDPAHTLIWRTEPSESGMLRIVIPEERAPGAPRLWFVEVEDARGTPPSTHLVAFASDDLPPGTVISRYRFANLGVPNDRQAGAVQWRRDGRVLQIFVAPDRRRRNVGTALLHAADAWHQARERPGHLHADGRRTRLGQLFLAAIAHPQRFAPLSEEMPPMDPEERRRHGTFSRPAASEQQRGGLLRRG